MIVDQPQPEIAGSAVILGEVHVGAGAILAQGLVARSHGAAGRVRGTRRCLRQAARPFR